MLNLRNNLPLLYDFYIVACNKSFSKAARNNCTSQPSLSRNVGQLEDILNLKLLNRSNKGISLTSDGEQLFNKLKVVFDNLNYDNEIKTIVIGTTRNIADNILANYLCAFYNSHPNIEIKIITDSASNLNNYLLNHRIDVLIDYIPQINFTEKDGFEIKTMSQFNTCFACNKSFYEKNKKNIKSLHDLSKYNLIIPGASRRRQMLDEVLQNNNIILKPKMQMPDSKLMIDIVLKSNFIGYFIEEEINDTNLIKLNLKEKLPINPFGIVYSKKTNKVALEFVELLLKR